MWSRRGNLIVYEGAVGDDMPSIKVVGADGGGAATVGVGSLPQWAPHGTELLYLRQEYEFEEPRLVVHEVGRRGERLVGAVTPEPDLQRVEVITTASHRTVDAFDVDRTVLDLGFTRSSIAVLIEERSRRIELRALMGRVRWRVNVRDVNRLAASGRWIVFADEKTLPSWTSTLRAIDAQTGRARVLVLGRDLHGLSLEGKRVIWAEEAARATRVVMALDLP